MSKKKKGYITRRLAPKGYVAVTKPLARMLYERGENITLCGNNVNSFHVFGGWALGCNVNVAERGQKDFDYVVNSFLQYLDRELGTYCVFYVKCSTIKRAEKELVYVESSKI